MATSDFTPIVSEVAAYLRVRTKDANGNEVGTFDADTRPTAEQVAALIPKGVRKLSSRIGIEICEGGDPDKQVELYGDAKSLAALWTAMQVEISYFAEQVGSSRSPYEQMKQMFDEEMRVLVEAITEHCGGRGGLSTGGRGPKPAHSMPYARVIGRETNW